MDIGFAIHLDSYSPANGINLLATNNPLEIKSIDLRQGYQGRGVADGDHMPGTLPAFVVHFPHSPAALRSRSRPLQLPLALGSCNLCGFLLGSLLSNYFITSVLAECGLYDLYQRSYSF
jgi:hypothetical protein